MKYDMWEELAPNLTYQFVPEIWFQYAGNWDDLGPMGLHMWFAEPWESVTVINQPIRVHPK